MKKVKKPPKSVRVQLPSPPPPSLNKVKASMGIEPMILRAHDLAMLVTGLCCFISVEKSTGSYTAVMD